MQDHPNAEHAHHRTCPDLQRAILRILIEDPSDDGIALATLICRLDRTSEDIADAIDELLFAGLVYSRGPLIRATGATLHLDQLWRPPR
jgi:hypothetical protein